MGSSWTGIIFLLNLYISVGNAYAAGLSWPESKAIGGWVRVVVCSAAIMSACGFIWCELIFLMFGAALVGYLEPNDVETALHLGYVVVIFPLLGSGLALWMHSVTKAWHQSSLSNVLTASYNTLALTYDVYQAGHLLPDAFTGLSEFFKGGEVKSKAHRVVILLVVISVCSGIFTTIAIVRYAARQHARQTLATLKKVRVDGSPA